MTKSVKSSRKPNAFHINFFETFLGLLEKELNTEAVAAQQGHHSIGNTQRYDARMEAVNFSLNHDDGVSDKNLKEADVILMGGFPFRQKRRLVSIWPCNTVSVPPTIR